MKTTDGVDDEPRTPSSSKSTRPSPAVVDATVRQSSLQQPPLFDLDPKEENNFDPEPRRLCRPSLRHVLRRLTELATCLTCSVIGFHVFLALIIYVSLVAFTLPFPPAVRLTSLSSTAFHASGPEALLTSAWSATFTVFNPNRNLKFRVDVLEMPLSYGRGVVAVGSSPPFELAPAREEVLAAETPEETRVLENDMFQDLRRDRRHGMVGLDLAMAMQGSEEFFWVFHRPMIMNVWCLDFNVTFRGPEDAGFLSGGPLDCLVLL